ncbi:divalent-cation tolerance protein CutA [bacterium]|nr:divalent-cation tolerance protein CutA [bacterium]
MEFIVIYCTVPNKKEGKDIAKVLVEDGLAACVNIIDKIDSVFSWDNEVCEEHEAMLMIKTRKIFFEQIRVIIKRMHSYNIPEIIALPVVEADETYLKWIAHETRE